MGKRDLSDEQAARVLARLRRRLAEKHEGNVLDLSRALGYSQAALWQLFNDRTRPSLAMAEALARIEGVPVEGILHSPRERAAVLAREGGVPDAAVRRVLAEPEPPGERAVLWWIDRMRLVAHTLSDDAPTSGALPSSSHPRKLSA